MQQVASDKIVWIFRQFTSSHYRHQMMNAVERHEEQEQATDQLGKAVEAFADDADHKKAVEPILWSEHDHACRRRSILARGAEGRVHVFGVGFESFLAPLQGRGRVRCCRNRKQIAAP